MCTSCRGRFSLPVVSAGVCEVCWTLQRLNRVILTRHPREESSTLLKLLQRLVGKVEGFVEEHEANQSLGRGQVGGVSLGTPAGSGAESSAPAALAPGLTPVAKRSTRPSHPRREQTPEEDKERRAERRREGERQRDESARKRSPSPEKRKSRSRRRRPEGEVDRDRNRRKEKPEEDKKAEREGSEERRRLRGQKAAEETDESPTREDRRSPLRRHGEVSGGQGSGGRTTPATPSRSPPGYRRGDNHQGEGEARPHQEKEKKDKGYNHYLRGVQFREKYGYNRGRGGRGKW